MTKGKTRSVSKFFKELVFVFVMYIHLGLLNNNNKKTEKNLDVLYSTCLSHLFTSAYILRNRYRYPKPLSKKCSSQISFLRNYQFIKSFNNYRLGVTRLSRHPG